MRTAKPREEVRLSPRAVFEALKQWGSFRKAAPHLRRHRVTLQNKLRRERPLQIRWAEIRHKRALANQAAAWRRKSERRRRRRIDPLIEADPAEYHSLRPADRRWLVRRWIRDGAPAPLCLACAGQGLEVCYLSDNVAKRVIAVGGGKLG